MNFYCWSMEVYNNKLYLGTFDASVFLRYLNDYTGPLPSQLQQLEPIPCHPADLAFGANLWQSSDGINWSPIALDGLGDEDNYGFRTMQVFDNKLTIGTSNPFEGCQIHQLTPLF